MCDLCCIPCALQVSAISAVRRFWDGRCIRVEFCTKQVLGWRFRPSSWSSVAHVRSGLPWILFPVSRDPSEHARNQGSPLLTWATDDQLDGLNLHPNTCLVQNSTRMQRPSQKRRTALIADTCRAHGMQHKSHMVEGIHYYVASDRNLRQIKRRQVLPQRRSVGKVRLG
jgi:hypothetical protein